MRDTAAITVLDRQQRSAQGLYMEQCPKRCSFFMGRITEEIPSQQSPWALRWAKPIRESIQKGKDRYHQLAFFRRSNTRLPT